MTGTLHKLPLCNLQMLAAVRKCDVLHCWHCLLISWLAGWLDDLFVVLKNNLTMSSSSKSFFHDSKEKKEKKSTIETKEKQEKQAFWFPLLLVLILRQPHLGTLPCFMLAAFTLTLISFELPQLCSSTLLSLLFRHCSNLHCCCDLQEEKPSLS